MVITLLPAKGGFLNQASSGITPLPNISSPRHVLVYGVRCQCTHALCSKCVCVCARYRFDFCVSRQMRSLDKYEYILNDCIGHLTITQQKIRDLAASDEGTRFSQLAGAETMSKYVFCA